jgi:outer membrane receptor for ferrienterochelin and colicin
VRIPLLVVSLLLIQLLSVAQTTFRTTIRDANGKPVTGVTVVIGGRYTAITDSTGTAQYTAIPDGKYKIEMTHIGYSALNDSIMVPPGNSPSYTLEIEPIEEEEVVILSTRSSRTIKDIPTRVEFIAGEELDEKANMKPGDIRMLLSESTGIQTQQTSPATANASIRIQGLDGRYTQILKDGFPLYSGFSGGLGLLQTPPLDLKQAEVIKGSSSTLYGGGAIAGLVNLISKTPKEEGEFTLHLNGTSAGGLDLHSFFGKRGENTGITFFAARNSNQAYDPSNTGFTAIPQFERYTFNPKFFLWPGKKDKIILGLNTVFENRLGGDIRYVKGARDTAHTYFEKNQTQRSSTQLSYTHNVHEHCFFTLKNSFNFFSRKLSVPAYQFDAKQFSSFTEAVYTQKHANTEWVYGINLFTDQLTEKGEPATTRDYQQVTTGAFIQQNTIFTPYFSLETGLRGDHVKDYGLIVLPRAAALFKFNKRLSSRIGIGWGYKTPTIFTEETETILYKNVLPVNVKTNVPERSLGINGDLNYRTSFSGIGLSVNQLFFFTRINRPLLLKPAGSTNYQLENINGKIISQGTETNIKLTYGAFKLFIGHTFTNVNIYDNGVKKQNHLTPKHRLNNVLMYEVEEKWKLGLEAYYFGKQSLNDGLTGKSYWICGFMAERLWKSFSVYINFENFFDARQTRNDVIYTGSINNPRFRDIYAPLDGFVVNGGIKLRL